MWGYGLDRAGSEQGQVVGTCECGNGTLSSVKCDEFDQLRNGQLLKKDFALWSEQVSECEMSPYFHLQTKVKANQEQP